jgi:hypothetical protein
VILCPANCDPTAYTTSLLVVKGKFSATHAGVWARCTVVYNGRSYQSGVKSTTGTGFIVRFDSVNGVPGALLPATGTTYVPLTVQLCSDSAGTPIAGATNTVQIRLAAGGKNC